MEEKIIENAAETMDNVIEVASDKKARMIGGILVSGVGAVLFAGAIKLIKMIKSKKTSEEVEESKPIETAEEEESDEVE